MAAPSASTPLFIGAQPSQRRPFANRGVLLLGLCVGCSLLGLSWDSRLMPSYGHWVDPSGDDKEVFANFNSEPFEDAATLAVPFKRAPVGNEPSLGGAVDEAKTELANIRAELASSADPVERADLQESMQELQLAVQEASVQASAAGGVEMAAMRPQPISDVLPASRPTPAASEESDLVAQMMGEAGPPGSELPSFEEAALEGDAVGAAQDQTDPPPHARAPGPTSHPTLPPAVVATKQELYQVRTEYGQTDGHDVERKASLKQRIGELELSIHAGMRAPSAVATDAASSTAASSEAVQQMPDLAVPAGETEQMTAATAAIASAQSSGDTKRAKLLQNAVANLVLEEAEAATEPTEYDAAPIQVSDVLSPAGQYTATPATAGGAAAFGQPPFGQPPAAPAIASTIAPVAAMSVQDAKKEIYNVRDEYASVGNTDLPRRAALKARSAELQAIIDGGAVVQGPPQSLASRTPAPAAPSVATSASGVRMSRLFTSNMVLQHSEPVVGGFCRAGTEVQVAVFSELDNATALETVAAPCTAGTFLASLSPRVPGATQHRIDVSVGGALATSAAHVLFGSVIVCGGQSNMNVPIIQQTDQKQELESATYANYPLLRFVALTANPVVGGKPGDVPSATADDVTTMSDLDWLPLSKNGEANDCVSVKFGPNTGSNTKMMDIEPGYTCPVRVDKTNWLRGEQYPDVFSMKTQGNHVVATRTDQEAGWDFALTVECCRMAGKVNKQAGRLSQFSSSCWNVGKNLDKLHKAQGVAHPIGLIDASLGSTRIECWMSSAAIDACSPVYNKYIALHNTGTMSAGNAEAFTKCGHNSWLGAAGTFYDGMIVPLGQRLRAAAVVWQTGESNQHDHTEMFHCSGDGQIKSWRAAFWQTDLPFFVLQMGPCCGDNEGYVSGSIIRNAQRLTATTSPDTHLVVVNDIGETEVDAHRSTGYAPRTHPMDNRNEMGRRVAIQVFDRLFGQTADKEAWRTNTETSDGIHGPAFQAASFVDGALRLQFANALGLHWRPTYQCEHYLEKSGETACCNAASMTVHVSSSPSDKFESVDRSQYEYFHSNPYLKKPEDIAAYDFVPASATVHGSHMSVTLTGNSLITAAPTRLRLQWDSQPLCVLVNNADLPATAMEISLTDAGWKTAGSATASAAPAVASSTAAPPAASSTAAPPISVAENADVQVSDPLPPAGSPAGSPAAASQSPVPVMEANAAIASAEAAGQTERVALLREALANMVAEEAEEASIDAAEAEEESSLVTPGFEQVSASINAWGDDASKAIPLARAAEVVTNLVGGHVGRVAAAAAMQVPPGTPAVAIDADAKGAAGEAKVAVGSAEWMRLHPSWKPKHPKELKATFPEASSSTDESMMMFD